MLLDQLTALLALSLSHPGSASAHPTPALVLDAQGGITLGPEQGELSADFTYPRDDFFRFSKKRAPAIRPLFR
jgi:hypothetical protein